MAGTVTRTANPRERTGQREKGSRAARILVPALVGSLPQRGRARRARAVCDPGIVRAPGMTETAVKLQPPVTGYFAYWIDRLRIADDLPAALAGRLVRAAIHEAPAACRPPPLEAWLFDAATDHGDGIDCAHVVSWLRLRPGRWATRRACWTRKRRGTGIGSWAFHPGSAGRAGRGRAGRSRMRPNAWVLA